jgi:hypothetical protein
MPAGPLYPTICALVQRYAPSLTKPAQHYLALLVTALLLARSAVVRELADVLWQTGLAPAQRVEHAERLVRRALSHPALTLPLAYQPALVAALGLEAQRHHGVVLRLLLDETTHTDRWHVLALRLAYRGSALVVAQRVWPQNQPLPRTHYWAALGSLLAEAHAALGPGFTVVVIADRAYDVPTFLDRVWALGWHVVVRLKANSRGKLLDAEGVEHEVRAFFTARLPQRGSRWQGTARLFKRAGWRTVQVAGGWAADAKERLVVLSDLPLDAPLLAYYDVRYWIEASFKQDKSAGFDWEASRASTQAHQESLLVAMAWARLLAVTVGEAEAEAKVVRPTRRPAPPQAHARTSLFRLGLRAMLRYLVDASSHLPLFVLRGLDRPSWNDECRQQVPAPAA